MTTLLASIPVVVLVAACGPGARHGAGDDDDGDGGNGSGSGVGVSCSSDLHNVLDGNGNVLVSQDKEFSSMRYMQPSSVTDFLTKWKR